MVVLCFVLSFLFISFWWFILQFTYSYYSGLLHWLFWLSLDTEVVTSQWQWNKPGLLTHWNGRHFPDGISKWISLNENGSIFIKSSPKFVPKDPISIIPAMVQIIAWRRPGDKLFSEPMMFVYRRINAPFGLNELTVKLPVSNHNKTQQSLNSIHNSWIVAHGGSL